MQNGQGLAKVITLPHYGAFYITLFRHEWARSLNLMARPHHIELKVINQTTEDFSTLKYEGWIPRRDNKGLERIVMVGLDDIIHLAYLGHISKLTEKFPQSPEQKQKT